MSVDILCGVLGHLLHSVPIECVCVCVCACARVCIRARLFVIFVQGAVLGGRGSGEVMESRFWAEGFVFSFSHFSKRSTNFEFVLYRNVWARSQVSLAPHLPPNGMPLADCMQS